MLGSGMRPSGERGGGGGLIEEEIGPSPPSPVSLDTARIYEHMIFFFVEEVPSAEEAARSVAWSPNGRGLQIEALRRHGTEVAA